MMRPTVDRRRHTEAERGQNQGRMHRAPTGLLGMGVLGCGRAFPTVIGSNAKRASYERITLLATTTVTTDGRNVVAAHHSDFHSDSTSQPVTTQSPRPPLVSVDDIDPPLDLGQPGT